MTTWQSKRRAKRHGRPQPSPQALQAKRDRADAERMARAAPIYPPDRRPGEWRGYVLFVIDGCTTRVELHQGPAARGRRPRCDSFQSRDEMGADLATGGLHAICRQAIAEEIPRALPREAYADLEH